MRANFVDTVMARLDGEVATIWATVLLRLEDRPDVALLRRGLRALVRESERLNVAWNDARRAWVPAVRGDAEVDAALVEGAEPLSEPDAVARIINTRVDLTRDVPLRLHLHPMVDAAQGPWLLGIQLHHAIGDAKALAHLLERLWLLCAGRGSQSHPLEPSTLTDGKVLLAALRHPGRVLGLMRPRRRLLAQRGMGLRRSGDTAGHALSATARLTLPQGDTDLQASEVFLSALLAGVALRESAADGLIRLRMPVDLRRMLGLGRTLGNGCSAVPVEISLKDVRARLTAPRELARFLRAEVRRVLDEGVHWTTALECMAVARLAPARVLRKNARPGLIAEPRTNTLVATYLGRMDTHFTQAPFRIRSMRSHTATWGATGLSFADTLNISTAAFEGLWTREELRDFTERVAGWASSGFGLRAEVLAP
ncbi:MULTISPECIES: hypothetical protein [unclassified Corallococcus]|uniref:hypothetical protein n=1 Tax=unclassified Corallococcus TaxID=2685029 RepID=UPI001A8CC26F|nr:MULTISPECIES: hypothetical protein [unclassified Corallococcus]MBN9685910.1 hypothetical protein [Corallococcus sp. NCSPR001]WAS82650.1 hypothetical protein O0N60_25380 [Corallococcus sp. NCRR]